MVPIVPSNVGKTAFETYVKCASGVLPVAGIICLARATVGPGTEHDDQNSSIHFTYRFQRSMFIIFEFDYSVSC